MEKLQPTTLKMRIRAISEQPRTQIQPLPINNLTGIKMIVSKYNHIHFQTLNEIIGELK